MVYKDVLDNRWHLLLPLRNFYTKRDVELLYRHFQEKGEEKSRKICRFITLSTAIYYDKECSNYIYMYNSVDNEVKRMLGLD